MFASIPIADMSQEILQSIEDLLDRKMSAPSNGQSGSTPWWNKSLFVMGPTAAIALALVAQQMGWTPSPLREDHKKIMSQIANVETRQDKTVDLLMQICINLAETDAAKGECIKIARYTQSATPTIPQVP
jgi:uncharacterized protein (DUF1501 family)